ncbi:lactonase family protein [Streptomyces sp. NBC_01795]|uniref:lactonase family protein n=1 Tax=unclassified Streptomyces TaxID=2593676 RepID=UPI002DDB3200|nr:MULTISPECIES: lactonase family protein [unclassified Streptomyces]WSA90324.1 lactonase family protein [Streptomyces sp. NBC_01795]WSB74550.1 lactonase family protein [Streptomyces sp. NBC_01775]
MTDGTERQQLAYIGSFTSAGGRGITTAAVTAGTGALTALHHTEDAVANPSFLTLAPGGRVLYTVSETDPGAAAALSLPPPGSETGATAESGPRLLGGAVPVDGAAPTHVALAAGCLYTANYGSGDVSALPLRADGSLGGQVLLHPHTGRGPNEERQEGPHAHAVVPDPSGRWLLSTDLGTDSVWIYDLRGPEHGLRLHREIPLRPGTGPRHLAFHPRPAGEEQPPGGSRAYVINELDPTVTACRWDAEDGTLEPLGETRLLPREHRGSDNYPSALALSPDGRFAWAANRGVDSIAVLALTADGLPELLTTVPCGGHWPRDLAVHPSGRWLYAANERSGDVTWFDVAPTDGTPHRAGSLTAPAASCVLFA